MDAVKIIEDALHDLEQSKITCSEFDWIVGPYRNCVPVNRGHWTKISPANIYECSVCYQNVMTEDIEEYHFCHHCGADMRESE